MASFEFESFDLILSLILQRAETGLQSATMTLATFDQLLAVFRSTA